MTELNGGRGKDIMNLRHLCWYQRHSRVAGCPAANSSTSQHHEMPSGTSRLSSCLFNTVCMRACVRVVRGCLVGVWKRTAAVRDEPGTRTPSRVVRWMKTLAGCRWWESERMYVRTCLCVCLSLFLSLYLSLSLGVRVYVCVVCVCVCIGVRYILYMRVHVYVKGGSVREGKRACLAHWRLTVGPTDRSVRRYQRRGAVWVAEPGAQASGRHQYPTEPSRTDSRLWTIDRSVSVTKNMLLLRYSVTNNII